MPLIQFNKTYFWWETQKTYKLGEIIEVDSDQFKELTSKGVAVAYVEPPVEIEEVLEGERTIQFLKTTEEYKCGEVKTIEANQARNFIKKGIAVYWTPVEEVKSYTEGKQTVQFLRTTIEYKINDIVELDNKIAIPLIEKGIVITYVEPQKKERKALKGKDIICFKKSVDGFKNGDIVELDANAARDYKEQGFAVAAKEESEQTKLLKSIYKMNREELLEFAKERKINVFPYKSENLVRRLIIIALERGE